MSVEHELELDSQTELLERLQLLTRFGSNLVSVFGGLGAGKSWLAQRYLEYWAADKNQSLLLCHPNQSDEQHRTTILSQVLSEPLFNAKDALLDSFSRLIDERMTCDIVVVIDDAHLLSDTLLSELWMWVLEAQTNPRWTINVVLFAQANRLDALLTRLTYGQEHKPIELEIEPLSEYEADRLFEQRVMRYVDPALERQARIAYKKVNYLPGEIMALVDQKREKRIIIRSIIGSPLNIGLLVLLLMLFIGGGYWWLWSQPAPNEPLPLLTQHAEQTVIPTLPSQQDNARAYQNVAVTPSQPNTSNAMADDAIALPPKVVESLDGVGIADSAQQRVVITSDVVDALLDGRSGAIDATENRSSTTPTTHNDSSITDGSLPSSGPIRFSFAREELMAMSPRSYTLQLAAVNSLQEVQNFMDRYSLTETLYVYPTVRDEVDWYIVTYDNYPTIQLARDAVATLPPAVQALGPWAKSLSQVQREIQRAK